MQRVGALAASTPPYNPYKNFEPTSESVFNFFLNYSSAENALDVIELFFKIIQDEYENHPPSGQRFIDALEELNHRFKEHGVGYQFESGEIIRVDSQFLHVEAVQPTLAILHNKKFTGANDEFLKAHEHYRHGRYKEGIVEALKAFESTMKTICECRGWPTQKTDTAKKLIDTCMENGLFPSYLDSQLSSIRSLLGSGVTTIRNKSAGHGQGTTPITVPEYFARYTLNLTATTILFMVEAHESTK